MDHHRHSKSQDDGIRNEAHCKSDIRYQQCNDEQYDQFGHQHHELVVLGSGQMEAVHALLPNILLLCHQLHQFGYQQVHCERVIDQFHHNTNHKQSSLQSATVIVQLIGTHSTVTLKVVQCIFDIEPINVSDSNEESGHRQEAHHDDAQYGASVVAIVGGIQRVVCSQNEESGGEGTFEEVECGGHSVLEVAPPGMGCGEPEEHDSVEKLGNEPQHGTADRCHEPYFCECRDLNANGHWHVVSGRSM